MEPVVSTGLDQPATLTQLVNLIAGYRFRFSCEASLQNSLDELFRANQISFEREVIIGPTDRLDFLIDGGIAVEVKINGSLPALTRQVFRYAKNDRVRCILIVTSRLRLASLSDDVNGKPVSTVYLQRGLAL